MFLAYENSNGVAIVTIPAGVDVATIIERVVPRDVKYCFVETLPEDKTFRDAWYLDNRSIRINLDKARDIWRSILRTRRAPKLQALDVEFMLALEKGDDARVAEVKKQKNRLRDLPADPRIDSARTVSELKQVKLDA